MSCGNNILVNRGYSNGNGYGGGMAGREHLQSRLSCGFLPGYAHFTCRPEVKRHVKSVNEHIYPVHCPEPKLITIERVVQVAGVDNALFLVGDVNGYRQNRNFTVEIPGDSVNVVSGNFPSYLLLKDGNMHALGFSTGNIEAVLRQNRHMFERNGMVRADVSLFPDLAPQDMSVADMDGEGCPANERHFRFRIVSNTTLNDSSTTIEILVFECDVLIDREIWMIIPVRCENSNTVLGANWSAWVNTPRTCGEAVFIPGRSTDNGVFILSNIPRCGCGCDCFGVGVRGAGSRPVYGGYGY